MKHVSQLITALNRGGLFLDKSKAFDKVWYERLLDFLRCQKQGVILNKQYSSWYSVNERVCHVSSLGP